MTSSDVVNEGVDRTKTNALYSDNKLKLGLFGINCNRGRAMTDHISGGRACLNIVNGWFEPEFKMFGIDFLPHDQRYGYTTEWYELVKMFWTEPQEFSFHGKFFDIEGGYFLPKPIQMPLPAVMNAGGSAAGRGFTASYADMGYVLLTGYDIEASRQPEFSLHLAFPCHSSTSKTAWRGSTPT